MRNTIKAVSWVCKANTQNKYLYGWKYLMDKINRYGEKRFTIINQKAYVGTDRSVTYLPVKEILIV